MNAAITLPVRLDLTVARPLARDLRSHAAPELVIDASRVAMLGGLCLQVLLAAGQDRKRRGQRMTVAPRSAAFENDLACFGLTVAALENGGMQ